MSQSYLQLLVWRQALVSSDEFAKLALRRYDQWSWSRPATSDGEHLFAAPSISDTNRVMRPSCPVRSASSIVTELCRWEAGDCYEDVLNPPVLRAYFATCMPGVLFKKTPIALHGILDPVVPEDGKSTMLNLLDRWAVFRAWVTTVTVAELPRLRTFIPSDP